MQKLIRTLTSPKPKCMNVEKFTIPASEVIAKKHQNLMRAVYVTIYSKILSVVARDLVNQ